MPTLAFLGIEHFNPPWDVFFLPLFNLLIASYELLLNDFALAIIVFTIIIRTILAPLFIKQIRSAKEMQRMAPLIREVQRKHKGNRQKVGEETMALYREHGVNPAAGCLPVIVQLPILFALYQALIRASSIVHFVPNEGQRERFAEFLAQNPAITEVANRPEHYHVAVDGACSVPQEFGQFLPLNCQLIDPIKLSAPVETNVGWLFNLNLANVDTVFSVALFGGFVLSGLAVIAAILQFVQVKMTSPRPNPEDPTSGITNTMIYTFPILTIVWGGIFPSGLILYWVIYTAYLVIQQYFILGWGNLFPLFGWQPSWAVGPEAGVMPQPRRTASAREEATEDPQPSTPSSSDKAGGRDTRGGGRRRGGRRRGRRR